SASSDLTLSGAILGTPNYMAPEQAQGKTRELTTAADVYSLGTILYQLITGKVPFQAATPLETLRLVLEEDPPRPSTVNLKIDRDLETICLKCLEKNPSQRYGSAESLALDLERWLRHEPIVARPGTAWANTIKWVKRRPSAAIVIATIVVSTAVLLVTLGQSRIVLREQRDDALAEKLRAEHLLNEMQLGKAEDQFATGDAAAALANLAQVLRRDPSNELAAARMVSALDYRSFALRTTKAAVTNAVFAPVPNLTNSPDHTKRLVLAYTNFVRVIEAATGRTLFTLPHKEMVLSTTFSPDGLLIATASQDGTAHLWDAGTGVPIGPALTHDHYVIFANFSPDSRWLATGSQDGTAKIWRTDDGAEMGAPMLHQGFLSSAQFDDGAERLLTTARDGTIRLWNARTGEPLIEPIYQTAVKATLSADGMAIKALVSQKPEQTFYWTVPGPRLLPRKFPQQSKIMSIHFSRDGEKFVTGCVDGNARIWSLRAGALAAPLLHHAGTVWYACFSPDGTRVLTTSTDHTAQVWNVLTGEPIGAPMSHGDWVLFGGFSPDGKKVATGAGDNTARIWDVQTGLPLTEPLTNSGPVRSVFFNHKGDWLATAGRKGELAVWEVATGKLLQHYNLPGAINCARFSPDDRTILTAAFNGEAQLWDVKTGRAALSPFKHNSVVNSAQFSPDGNLAVTASSDHTAKVWDAHTGKMLSKVFHKGEIEYVEFFPDSRRFITVSRDKTARVWDARTGQALSESFVHDAGYRKLLSGFSQIGMADLSDNGQSLATIGDDGTAWIWAISSPPAPVPSWLPDLAEALGGKKLADSAIETVSSENLLEVQDKLGLEQTGFYKDWAQVFGK
ncbi:MAG: repeat-containing protein, partial [Pedosphaera sp.]|nr:repeat-containing protein [Pedosphaera sp.]